MAFHNPRGRVNYEPNSWGKGPREDPARGFRSYEAEEAGTKLRARPELFADHYSQARQFYESQTEVEQTHIRDALVFELSKVETPAIRERMVSHLRVIDAGLAEGVAAGLGLTDLPAAAEPARPLVTDLAPSVALSLLRNGPGSFRGRKIGVMVSDGFDGDLLAELEAAAEAEGATLELVAPKIGGASDAGGTLHPAKQTIAGGPSVLYDAVVLLVSEDEAPRLGKDAAARDFVADAFAHAKFIGHSPEAEALLEGAGVTPDAGCMRLEAGGAAEFIGLCRDLRYWPRETEVHAA